MDLDINKYINIFVEESKEHLQNMNDVLLELEKSPSNHDYINEIFRVAHTLKGMSGTMGFNNMGNLTHYMENVLQAIRNNEIEVSDEIIDLLFECFDALDTSVNHIMDYGLEDSKSYDELINRLNKLLSKERSNIVNSDDKSKINPSQKNIMELEHHLVKVLKKAKSEGLNVFKIDISLRETCMLKAAR
ncbi:MAG: chemotaxis protein CheA, partial [Tissierellia bacterium]|nr:chemotaxis protein CheA [Tissierellia bacterium]